MNRASLKFLAALLGTILAVVPFLGLDSLPRDVRAQVASEPSALASAQSEFRAAQDEVLRDLQTESDLFRVVPASGQWPDQLAKGLGDLQFASRDMDELSKIEKQNRRGDRERVESLLAHE